MIENVLGNRPRAAAIVAIVAAVATAATVWAAAAERTGLLIALSVVAGLLGVAAVIAGAWAHAVISPSERWNRLLADGSWIAGLLAVGVVLLADLHVLAGVAVVANDKLQVGNVIAWSLEWLTDRISGFTRAVSEWVTAGVEWIGSLFYEQPVAAALVLSAMLWWQLLPRRYLVLRPVVSVLAFVLGLLAPWVIPATEAVYATPVIIVLFTLGCWWVTRNWGVTIFCLVGLGLVWNMGWWFQGMQTLALVILATVIVLVLGVPLGVAAAVWRPFYRVITPILDFMQTLPAFVYLIPAIPFFGLGETAALFATVIFAMPPAIRLTTLGIQQVPEELVEAADAFGSTRMQRLIKLELPTAMPSVQAGTNQAVMLSLSMVVIAAMIGAPGLGDVVWTAIQRLNVAQGFEGGISIVILAIILDRVLRSAGQQAQPGAS